ncbi:MAG TPA: cytochrome c oxidase subunit II [Verrucomicrobiae bacterium]|nr:cytochrome c oxidase subunit II [Verrucomicrobiae bacterium]
MMKYFGLPVLASQHGADVDRLIVYIHILMALLFVGWAFYFVYTLWRFRASRRQNADYVGARTHASTYVEVAVAVAEMVLLFALAVPFWATAADKFPEESQSTVVRIIGRQFNWIGRYPGADGKFGANKLDLVASDNPLGLDKNDAAGKDDVVIETSEIAVPVNKPVIAHITSLDVIHSFKVVAIRMTQDATPGFSVPVHFVPTLTNTYQIQCSQLCGNGHYSMRGFFKVLPPEEYDAWIKSKPTVGAGAVSYE